MNRSINPHLMESEQAERLINALYEISKQLTRLNEQVRTGNQLEARTANSLGDVAQALSTIGDQFD